MPSPKEQVELEASIQKVKTVINLGQRLERAARRPTFYPLGSVLANWSVVKRRRGGSCVVLYYYGKTRTCCYSDDPPPPTTWMLNQIAWLENVFLTRLMKALLWPLPMTG